MKKIQNYIKGKVSLQKETLVDRSSDETLGHQENLTEDSAAEMFSKNYWFGENNEETQEPASDPWLPNMVCFSFIFFSFLHKIVL